MKRLPLALLLILPIAGCSPASNPLGGSVVYDGKPLEEGFISFLPADRTGVSVGGDVRSGQYVIADVPKGKYRVLVSVTPKVDTTARPKLLPNLPLTAKSPGNNAVHEITAGQKTLDVTISK